MAEDEYTLHRRNKICYEDYTQIVDPIFYDLFFPLIHSSYSPPTNFNGRISRKQSGWSMDRRGT